ncbi:MAG: hypothetical protein QOJ02_2270 [Acidobacteriota bacterium]|jgi:hypothetical protein|nr:hypothetical protein [Acidobacteriota bacterium]
MKRSFIFSTVLVLFVLALLFSPRYTSRTVKAASAVPDLCTLCFIENARLQDFCLAHGGSAQFCGDQYNRGVVFCFRAFNCQG